MTYANEWVKRFLQFKFKNFYITVCCKGCIDHVQARLD